MATTPRSDGEVSPGALEKYRDHDATLNWMMKNGIRLTREKYLFYLYGGTPPKAWTAEHESMLPEPFQHARRDE